MPDESERLWKILLGDLIQARVELNAVSELLPLTAPGLAASAEQVSAAEEQLGHPLDDQHRALLMHADGWVDMLLDVALLSTRDLMGTPLRESAQENLDLFYLEPENQDPEVPEVPDRKELYPLAVSRENTTAVYAIWRGGPLSEGGRPVFWLQNEVVQRYDNVAQFLASVTQRTRDVVDHLREGRTGL